MSPSTVRSTSLNEYTDHWPIFCLEFTCFQATGVQSPGKKLYLPRLRPLAERIGHRQVTHLAVVGLDTTVLEAAFILISRIQT